MPFGIGALTLILQASLAVHAFRTGRERWIFVIIFVPAIGGLVYFLTQILPDFWYSSTGRRASTSLAKVIAPSHNIQKLRDDLAILDTVLNRQLLARECVRIGEYQEGIELLLSCLRGFYETDPYMLLELAEAYFLAEQYYDAKGIFLRIRDANPEFKSAAGHLLYARTLENMRENESALGEYEAVARYFPGEEANSRYGLLLMKTGEEQRAKEIFDQILVRDRSRPRQYKGRERPWVNIARENVI